MSPGHHKVLQNSTTIRNALAALIIAIVVLAFLHPLAESDFVRVDDQNYIFLNPDLSPPTVTAVADYWLQPEGPLYIPVTHSVWAVTASFAYSPHTNWRNSHLAPEKFHIANLLVHLATAILVFLILLHLSGNWIAAIAGALLFTIHPLQVETVAWLSAMKDLLSGMFTMAAILLYLRAFHRTTSVSSSNRIPPISHNPLNAIIAITMFLLAVLSKPSAIVTPVVLLVIDAVYYRDTLKQSLSRLIPYIVIAIACALWTRYFQPTLEITNTSLPDRPVIALDAISFYLQKLVLPVDLTLDYGRNPDMLLNSTQRYFTWILPVGLLAMSVALRKRCPTFLAGLLIFTAAILPVSGLNPFFWQFYSTVSDHYVYIAMLGAAIVTASAVSKLPSRSIQAAVVGIVVLLLGLLSFRQSLVWENDLTLFSHMVDKNPDSFFAHNNLGVTLSEIGDNLPVPTPAETRQKFYRDALRHYEASVALVPANPLYRNNLALAYWKTGQTDTAMLTARSAIELMTGAAVPEQRQQLARAWSIVCGLHHERDEAKAATNSCNRALDIDPQNTSARQLLANMAAEGLTQPD